MKTNQTENKEFGEQQFFENVVCRVVGIIPDGKRKPRKTVLVGYKNQRNTTQLMSV